MVWLQPAAGLAAAVDKDGGGEGRPPRSSDGEGRPGCSLSLSFLNFALYGQSDGISTPIFAPCAAFLWVGAALPDRGSAAGASGGFSLPCGQVPLWWRGALQPSLPRSGP